MLLRDVAKVCVVLDEVIMSQCTTSYHKRQCWSFKATVLTQQTCVNITMGHML